MGKTKLFLLYYNEDISDYNHPDVIPLKLTQTPYFESEAFRMLEDLPNAENIGFLTPSAKNKIKDFSIEKILNLNPDPITFLYVINKQIEKDSVLYHGKNFLTVWKYIFNTHSLSYSIMNTYIGGYSNLWVAKREFVVEYLKFAKKTMFFLDTSPTLIQNIIFSDSNYRGKLMDTGILNTRFGFNHYPWHPFILERLINLFAKIKNVEKYKYLGDTSKTLRFINGKFRLV